MALFKNTDERDRVLKEIKGDPKFQKFYLKSHEIEANIICSLCLIEEGEDGNVLVICELGLAAIHQTGYLRELKDSVPEEDWFGQRCTEIIKNWDKQQILEDLSGKFGSEPRGIMVKNQKFGFFHIVGAEWLPQIEAIDKDGKISTRRKSNKFKDKVGDFGRIEEGSVAKGKFRRGKVYFHITGAIQKNLLKERNKMVGIREDGDITFSIFCHDHEKRGREKFILKNKKISTPQRKTEEKNNLQKDSQPNPQKGL